MTSARYQNGCSRGSQEHRDKAAWYEGGRVVVGFDNGNVNNNNDNNRCLARAVRVARECQGAECKTLFHELYNAYKDARRGKKPSMNKLVFEERWADGLLDLERRITDGTWEPSPYTCFVATRPKAREIHAPDFADRTVHHWAVAKIEPGFDRVFIEDSFANRAGKGSHAAVRRAQQFMRQVHSGQGGGWYLQLDIANFFYSIPRKLMWAILKRGMVRDGVPEQAQRVMHALLRRSAVESGVTYRSTAAQRALVPPHKQLKNAKPGCGLPIGNLPSQFLANVFMNEFDQFVKHVLVVKRYLRYVDDFVLFHHDRAQLERWLVEIEKFLGEKLGLSLKADIRLRKLTDGLDFLGYVLYPTHTRVRRRVISHARAAYAEWGQSHVRGRHLVATPADLRMIRSKNASYNGHFSHANSYRLRAGMHQRFPWLSDAIEPRQWPLHLEGQTLTIRTTA
ncbi:reverse transcriptase domain-containing protein [Solilutibacter silvestris]|uniref:RNA-directed DNA polymerase n=1 Tax=Solilutibacter silvestris TaxID=1645665 RepID=UPI003D357B2B